uniref:Uncharacterized protein n=1 Tax=Romanomermis culicivorax TaxID=13658 RepID=A0A915J9A1_ROMCU
MPNEKRTYRHVSSINYDSKQLISLNDEKESSHVQEEEIHSASKNNLQICTNMDHSSASLIDDGKLEEMLDMIDIMTKMLNNVENKPAVDDRLNFSFFPTKELWSIGSSYD